ncbi:alpha carbonic anhydrase [Aspergillus alliaceus]|uniref:alpha carbonic anhydrase n=1 Tax=Petromyces alliaceus TaxID=209559 RepID=UPI0012A52B2A|nr:alpha carbonic anhydrase [Aspergillus alliaceus]KAB8229482.1 alpha carbonic anhydrase [Aspergillus alliaceus]
MPSLLPFHCSAQTADKQTAVVGLFFQLTVLDGSVTPFESIFSQLDDIAHAGARTVTGELDFQVLTTHLAHFRVIQYTGSLTTPPCTEGVAWHLSGGLCRST